MSRRITIKWDDKDSIDNAIKELKEYQKKLHENETAKKFCVALAEIGRQRAQAVYDEFYLEGYNRPVTCEVQPTNGGAKLLANGMDVCFIEFGTGVRVDGGTYEGYTFYPGSWSASELGVGMFSELGYWIWEGEKFTGTPPAHALTKAIAEMESRASEVAQQLKGELT